MRIMNELALFAGAGGGLLASRWLLNWRTVCAVEIDPYRQAVLLARQADGLLDPFPIWPDVRDFDGRPWRGIVDVVTAGFPCQPFSVAGRRRGADDERNRWPDTIRVLREVRPRFALLENVPGLLAHEYVRTIFGDLAEAGFDAEWCVLGADDVGAPHRRKRLWILAHARRAGNEPDSGPREASSATGPAEGEVGQRQRSGDTAGDGGQDVPDAFRALGESGAGRRGVRQGNSELAYAAQRTRQRGTLRAPGYVALGREAVADAQYREAGLRIGGEQGAATEQRRRGLADSGALAHAEFTRLEVGKGVGRDDAVELASAERTGCDWWRADPAEAAAPESFVGRVADGVAHRVDRLAALGDGQVSTVVAAAWRMLEERTR